MELLVNVNKWIEENKTAFLPPVCNKLMHRYQLNVMFVGGPNERKDYHIEEGEELFYQVQGDMCLKIIENGKQKNVVIREGEVIAYGPGTTEKSKKNSDIWIWQLEGTSTVTMDGKTLTLSAGDSLLVRAQSTYSWKRAEECIALCITQDPKRKQPYT
ncbi:hypothetical protein BTVI_34404 [Pitangus sulphuratus]|nr:hypothetical protein BTVI_34404 [Pitangus sulphuratus]